MALNVVDAHHMITPVIKVSSIPMRQTAPRLSLVFPLRLLLLIMLNELVSGKQDGILLRFVKLYLQI